MRRFRKTLCVSYKDHVTNEEDRNQDPTIHRTIRRPPDNGQKVQTEVVRPRLTIIWPRKKTSCKVPRERAEEEEIGRQHQRVGRPGVRQLPEGCGEQGKMERAGCKVVSGAPTILTGYWKSEVKKKKKKKKSVSYG